MAPIPGFHDRQEAQTYTRLDESTYRYASGTFEAELTVDDDGLVAGYGVWRRTGVAMVPTTANHSTHPVVKVLFTCAVV